MIDHLRFNNTDFYQLLNTTIGRIPTRVTIPCGTIAIFDTNIAHSETVKRLSTQQVRGIKNVQYDGIYYLVTLSQEDDFHQTWSSLDNFLNCWVKSTDVTPIWGGKHALLTHLFQCFRHVSTFRNEVRTWL